MELCSANLYHSCTRSENHWLFFIGLLVLFNFYEISLLLGTIRDLISKPLRCLSGRGCAPAATVPSRSLSSASRQSSRHELRGRWMTHQRRVPTLSAHSPTRRHGRRPPTGTGHVHVIAHGAGACAPHRPSESSHARGGVKRERGEWPRRNREASKH